MKISKAFLKQIILEELTKTEIKEIAKEEAEKEVKAFLKKELEDEIIKFLKKRGGAQDEVATITRKMIKRLYRELSVNYPQILDRIKL